MARRYQAPEHTSSVFTATGEKKADKNGVITLADDAPVGDDQQLRSAGCQLIAEAAQAAGKESKA